MHASGYVIYDISLGIPYATEDKHETSNQSIPALPEPRFSGSCVTNIMVRIFDSYAANNML